MRMTMRKSNLLGKLFPGKPETVEQPAIDTHSGVQRALQHAAYQGALAVATERAAIHRVVRALESAVVALDEMADICRESIELCEMAEVNTDEVKELMMGARFAALITRFDRNTHAATVDDVNLIAGLGGEMRVPLAGPGGVDYMIAPERLGPWTETGLPLRLASRIDGRNVKAGAREALSNHLARLTAASDRLCADAQMLAWRLKTLENGQN